MVDWVLIKKLPNRVIFVNAVYFHLFFSFFFLENYLRYTRDLCQYFVYFFFHVRYGYKSATMILPIKKTLEKVYPFLIVFFFVG